jgi:hypothetical protein
MRQRLSIAPDYRRTAAPAVSPIGGACRLTERRGWSHRSSKFFSTRSTLADRRYAIIETPMVHRALSKNRSLFTTAPIPYA